MSNEQVLSQDSSGTLIEFKLLHSAGQTISAASPIISFISPKDTSIQYLQNPEVYEMPINIASGYYLVRPNKLMVDQTGTLVVYASGVGVALGQTGTKQSDLTRVYVDIVGTPKSPDNYITDQPQKLTLSQGSSGTLIEFKLLHYLGQTVSAASPIISFVSPKDTAIQYLQNPEVYEMPINIASGYYLVRPNKLMVDQTGTLIVYASGVGVTLGQTGTVQSNLTRVYVDIIGGELDENAPELSGDYITGQPQKLGYSVHNPFGKTTFKQYNP